MLVRPAHLTPSSTRRLGLRDAGRTILHACFYPKHAEPKISKQASYVTQRDGAVSWMCARVAGTHVRLCLGVPE